MAMVFESRTLSITIACNFQKVYEFVSNPENLPRWAAVKNVVNHRLSNR